MQVPAEIDVKLAAELAEMPLEEFMSLNPAHNRPVIAGGDTHLLLLPYDKAELFSAKLALNDQPLVSWRAYTLRAKDRIDALEKAVFGRPDPKLIRQILDEKRDISRLRRVMTPQRDVIARLARRDFLDISTDLSFRFRDVYDHIVRIADDATIFQDRISGILDAHLTNVSNRLNEVMKVLTGTVLSLCRGQSADLAFEQRGTVTLPECVDMAAGKTGALLGDSTKEAFFVRCDRSTMDQNDLDNGRLVCLIGVAVVKPAEFVIFRIGQKTADARD